MFDKKCFKQLCWKFHTDFVRSSCRGVKVRHWLERDAQTQTFWSMVKTGGFDLLVHFHSGTVCLPASPVTVELQSKQATLWRASQQLIVGAAPLHPHLSMLSFWCGPPRSQLCRTRTWTSWTTGSRPGRGADSAEWWRAWPWRISGTRWCRPAPRPAGDRTQLGRPHEGGTKNKTLN